MADLFELNASVKLGEWPGHRDGRCGRAKFLSILVQFCFCNGGNAWLKGTLWSLGSPSALSFASRFALGLAFWLAILIVQTQHEFTVFGEGVPA